MKEKTNKSIKKEFFREININKNVSGDYVLDIYYISKRTSKRKINYAVMYKAKWIIKLNGSMYKIFESRLNDLYCSPKSNILKNLGLVK